MIHKFIEGMRFILYPENEITSGWDADLSPWKGKILTVKEVITDEWSDCLVKENDEEWLVGDVDWEKTEKLTHYFWKINTERSDYRPVVVCHTYDYIAHLQKCYGDLYKYIQI